MIFSFRDEANNNPLSRTEDLIKGQECSTPVFQRRLPPIYRGGPPPVLTPSAKVETQEDFQAPQVISVITEECHKEVIESQAATNHQDSNNCVSTTEQGFSKSKERPNSSRIHLPKEDPIYEGDLCYKKQGFSPLGNYRYLYF